MFDVLVYLYENYYRPDACPDADTLARKLSAAGFEGEEIDSALSWLSDLATVTQTTVPVAYAESSSFRIYVDSEYERLGPESIGFLSFLESAGVLNPLLREVVVERALATDETPVSLEALKVIVLMVFWSQDEEPDALILEELLEDGAARQMH
jgi:Smg protein